MFKDTFKIEKGDVVAITGGGGKTSLMFHLAEELSQLGRVLVTTTTKIYNPSEEEYEKLIVGDEVFLGHRKNISVAARGERDGKLHGFSFEELEELLPEYDYILMEADGAKMKQMKGWREDEPVIPSYATKVIGVANIKPLGKRATQDNIHRLNTFLQMVDIEEEEEVDLEVFKRYLQRGKFFKGFSGERILFLNGVEEGFEYEAAMKLGSQVENFYFGSIKEKRIAKYKRVDAVVMASGYSRRFGEEDKLLKKIRGVPVVEHLFKTLEKLPLENIVVVGRNPEVKRLCSKYGYNYIENTKAHLGQSESIKAGLKVTSGEGTIFLTGDQPLIKEESLLKLLQTFQEEELITRPVSERVPSSPVIFPGRNKRDLMNLTGDMGGREVIRKAGRIAEVEFSGKDEFMDIDTVEDLLRAERIMVEREKS
jgi:probable selenium-dependent hydroxylase accessory protein YqeC